MPALATPTRPSNRGGSVKASPAKPLDIGQPLGIHDTNTVRSRVRQWQQQGGGVITINDGTYDDDGDENENQPRPLPASAKAKPGQVEKPDTEKERAAENDQDLETRKEEKKPKEKDKVPAVRKRSHSTPRKRVISDEHWRKNRSSTQTPSRNLPAPRRINEYTTNGGAGSPRARREIQKDVLDKTRDPPKFKHYRIQNGSSPTVEERRHSASRKDVDSVTDSECAGEHPGSVMASEMPSDMSKITSLPEETEWAKSEADFTELSRRRARGPSKPPKGGIFAHMLDESRKMFKLPEPEPPRPTPPPAGTRGAKIEAWLSETPDPFVETKNPKTDMPGPLDIKSARARRSQRIVDEIATSNPISDISHDSEARPKSSGSRPKSSHSRHSTHSEGSCATKDDGRAPQGSHGSSVEKPLALRIRRDKEKAHEPSEIDSLAPSESDFQPFSDGGSEVSGNNAPVPVGLKRSFPSTGLHRLSTIASRDTLSTLPEETTVSEKDLAEQKRPLTAEEAEEAAEKVDHFDPNSLPGVTSQLQRRLTTHKDLMSVLSVSASRSGSTRSRRSVRSTRSRVAHATISDLLAELRADEVKYMRELKTLVGGVVPVLLTCVLSRSDSAIAAGLFRPSLDPKDDLNFSKPIVNMGVATERLKTLHKRIPQEDVDALLAWAQGAQRVYREYLKAWRLGFKDVIVNLAPLEEGDVDGNADTKSLDEGMERDDQGDIIGANGEKVDVAYLLKRPLVRLKYLAKSFKGINNLQPSAKAEEIATAYASLVAEARKRARDERARLEDESAASIDPTRARDPMTLGLSSNVVVDQSRRVRARDFFNMSFYHSSGQLIDCRAELLYRDNTSSNGPGGDLLICEIDHSERWLLFPPMDLRCVSARVGDSKGEIVVMLRSAPEDERYWQELISLRIDEVDIVLEWVSLLGQDPIPPALCRSQSFISRVKQHKSRRSDVADSSPRGNSSDVEVPIGEKVTRKRRSLTPKDHTTSSNISASSGTDHRCSVLSATTRETENTTISDDTVSKGTTRPGLPQLPSTMSEKSVGALKRSKAKRHSRHADSSNPGTSSPQTGHIAQPTDAGLSVQTRFYGNGANAHETTSVKETTPKKTAQAPRPRESPEKESPRVSSTPSAYLPMIPKIRSSSSQTHLSSPSTPAHEEEEDYPPLDALPESPAFETPSRSERRKSRRKSKHEESPPPPPPHRSPSSSPNKLSNSPILPASGHRIKRRGSSPLKHEYEPSTASDYSETDSEASTVRHYTYSSSDSSESGSDSASCSSFSDDEEDEIEPPKPVLPQPSASDASSLSPSNSVSQGGYRTVPLQPTKSTKALATVFAWSDKGSWDSLVPDECSVVVSPGLIEAFNVGNGMNFSAPDRAYPHLKPVISMELTPLVPIRRGTAIDISIRSPPTDRSKMTSSNNIMFRSRNPDECDALYSLINQARLNNPTYIALQNARGPMYDNFVPDFEQPTEKAASNWFGFPRRRKSYRASDSPRSLAEGSESSVGTMSSAFSALKRFRGGSKMFNISRSTVISRSGREDSLYSSSGASSDPSPSSGIGRIAAAIKGADGIGLSNAKIRLYLRETASKWRDMGAARLTIMPAPLKNSPSRPGTAVSAATEDLKDDREESASPPSSGATTPRRDAESEKRIIIRGKTRGEILLDVCLPESSFERVARTGIAVSVYEENEGGVIAKQGGVGTGTQRIYMLQLKSEAEAAYTFGLVGKLRY